MSAHRPIAVLLHRSIAPCCVSIDRHTKSVSRQYVDCRLAPVQAMYLGYMGSLGGPFSDYYIAV